MIKMIPHISVVNEVFFLSLIYKPQAAQRIINGELIAFCSGDPGVLFEIPPRLNSTFREIMSTLCSLDTKVLEKEVAELVSIPEIERIVSF